MNQQLIIQVSEVILLLVVFVGFIVILFAGVYDIRAISRRHYFKEAAKKLRKPSQPHVTIIVCAKDDAASIVNCLRSIYRSLYWNYDIVVVDNVSRDDTRRLTREYMNNHPKVSCYLYAKRKAEAHYKTVHQAYKRSKQGDIVLVLDAVHMIPPTLLKSGVARLVGSQNLQAIKLNEYVTPPRNIAVLVGYFLKLSRHVVAKCASLLSWSRVTMGESGTMYYQHAAVNAGKRKIVSQFASDVVVTKMNGAKKGLASWRQRKIPCQLKLVTWLSATTVFLLLTYFMYTAATLQSSALLMTSWLAFLIWCLAIVWSEDTMKSSEKITLSFSVPIIYFLMYVELFIRAVLTLVKIIISTAFRKQSSI